MSDSEDSIVTYPEVSSPFKDLSDIGSPGVDGLPMLLHDPYAYVDAALQTPPSPSYVPGLECPPTPEFVSKLVCPEFMPPEDDEDPKEDDKDPEEDLVDYLIDREDDDEEEEESFGDDADDEEDDEDEDEEEKEEHPASTDSVPPPIYRVMTRMSVRAQTPISLPLEIEVARLLDIPSPPPLLLSPLSSPLPPILSPLPHILSPPLPISSPPLPTSTIYFPSSTVEYTTIRDTTTSTYTFTKSSSALTARPTRGFRVDYGFVGTLDDDIRQDLERERMTNFVMTVRQDIDEIYRRLDDAQDDRLLMSNQLNMQRRDRCAHARTARLVENKARISREAWVQSIDASDTAHDEELLPASFGTSGYVGPLAGPYCLCNAVTYVCSVLIKVRVFASYVCRMRSAACNPAIFDCCANNVKMAPKRTTRSTPATKTTTTTTPMTIAQLKAQIDQGVTDALVAHDAD
nr:hypothetical protein [Tanacetum cinerariifolium]